MAPPVDAEPIQIDVRRLSLEDRRAAIARALQELRRGRSVVLLYDRDPKPTVAALREMHQGEIECVIAILAADLFRATLRIRHPEKQLTLAEELRCDHARIDGLLTELQHFLRVGALAEADRHFAGLDQALSRHMATEEELLFPAMQRMTEAVARAVPDMLAEHGDLRAILPDLAYALVKQNVVAGETLVPQLRRSLARHHEDEERLVYPITDWALAPDEQADLIHRLRGA
jgi:uncharacterized protein (DUF2249 family)